MVYFVSGGRTVDVALLPVEILVREGYPRATLEQMPPEETKSCASRCIEFHLRRAEQRGTFRPRLRVL